MIYKLSDNITSPLGTTTGQNYRAVKAGLSALRRYDDWHGVPESFAASLFTDEQNAAMALDGLTRFESLAVRSISEALRRTSIDVTSPRVVLIVSTTKANVELLSNGGDDSLTADRVESPAAAAQAIATRVGITTTPVTVCNACVSGVAAIILAMRLLDAGSYDYAVVCGAEVQSTFTVAGFLSLKAASDSACRPFDMERTGLNLGEAAATIIFSRYPQPWAIEAGSASNDAYHVSAPSKNGEGARLALQSVLESSGSVPSDIGFINAHGTATMFNDQMESVAIERAGLSAVPVNGLKGYYGHTLGAAGLIETVLSMAAADDNVVLGTRGFEERGVSGKILVSAEHLASTKPAFIKMISGFGGANAALLARRSDARGPLPSACATMPAMMAIHRVRLTPQAAIVDNRNVGSDCSLTALYKRYVDDYPKFYKMDGLCRLGFLAAELLLKAEGTSVLQHPDSDGTVHDRDRAVILFNRSSSVDADVKFQASIAHAFFPSPSVFVYTLPNIVTGEIAIRNRYHGETAFYVLPGRDDTLMQQIVGASLLGSATTSVMTGWVDYVSDACYEADLVILQKQTAT